MTLIAIFIGALLVLGIAAYALGNLNRKRQGDTPTEEDKPAPRTDMECCGQHAVCERDSLLAGVSRKIEYYDDEELDRFRGTPSDGYNDEDADAFREVLYTMRPDDVPGWVRSLQLRGVSLPDGVKDEIILIVDDLRAHPVPKS